MARRQNVEHVRYRFSVPKADESVNSWIDAQGNLSHSIRTLIKEHIKKHGIMDATCTPVEQQARVGRPPKQEIKETEFDNTSAPEEQVESLVQDAPVSAPQPQIATKQPAVGRMSIPIVDGTEKGLNNTRTGSGETEPMMDMTALMSGGR